MHLHALPTLLFLTTSVLANALLPRSDCSLKTKATTIAGSKATVTGPFALKVSAASSVNQAGNRAYGVGGGKIVFDIPPSNADAATSFYLNNEGHFILIDGGKVYTAYEKDADATGNMILGTSKSTNLKCSVDKGSCELKCKVDGGSYNCLASPKDKPDWCIGKSKGSVAGNCIPFTPVIVPR